MRLAVFRAMLIGLLRDPAALVISFALPAVVYLIFAVIFAGASGGSLVIRIAVLDKEATGASRRLTQGLQQHAQIRLVGLDAATQEAVTKLVRTGAADVGVVLRGGKRTLASGSAEGEPPILLITDPTREIAIAVVEGIVQETYFRKLPDIVIGGVARIVERRLVGLTPPQQAQLAGGLEGITDQLEKATDPSKPDTTAWKLPFLGLVERLSSVGVLTVSTSISYYAGAVAIMFLLFSAMNGALTLRQEKDSGLLERLSTGPSGIGPIVDGKFIFIWAQGITQVGVIFVVAWLGFGLDLPGHLVAWIAVTCAASASTAGLMLAFAALCRTQQQAQNLGTILNLIACAIGGSMIPRFLMPPYIQDLGWITPNTWALEGYGAIFWRNEPWSALYVPIAALVVSGLAGVVVARMAMASGR